jgi:hypothetical protein
MTGPKENVKIFGLRPLEAVAGLVPGGRHCVPIMAALPGLGTETDLVGILHGADGLRILDPEPHGIGQRVLKFFESWGYHTEIIKLYDEGLRKDCRAGVVSGPGRYQPPDGRQRRPRCVLLRRRTRGVADRPLSPTRFKRWHALCTGSC